MIEGEFGVQHEPIGVLAFHEANLFQGCIHVAFVLGDHGMKATNQRALSSGELESLDNLEGEFMVVAVCSGQFLTLVAQFFDHDLEILAWIVGCAACFDLVLDFVEAFGGALLDFLNEHQEDFHKTCSLGHSTLKDRLHFSGNRVKEHLGGIGIVGKVLLVKLLANDSMSLLGVLKGEACVVVDDIHHLLGDGVWNMGDGVHTPVGEFVCSGCFEID